MTADLRYGRRGGSVLLGAPTDTEQQLAKAPRCTECGQPVLMRQGRRVHWVCDQASPVGKGRPT